MLMFLEKSIQDLDLWIGGFLDWFSVLPHRPARRWLVRVRLSLLAPAAHGLTGSNMPVHRWPRVE